MEIELKIKVVKCIECHNEFALSIGEQEFYKSKKLLEPKRCPSCRRLRKLNNPNKEDKNANNI